MSAYRFAPRTTHQSVLPAHLAACFAFGRNRMPRPVVRHPLSGVLAELASLGRLR